MSNNGAARTLPLSLEAEDGLLSTVCVDAADVIPRAREAGINAGSFYDTKHGVIFACQCALYDRGLPVAADTIAVELKRTGQLEHIGGLPFVTQACHYVQTTASASLYIGEVRALALLREIIRTTASVNEDCYSFTGAIDEFTADIERRISAVTRNGSSMRSRLDAARLNPDAEPPPLTVRFTLKGIPIATPGNLVAVCAQAKAGKSAFIGACIGATFTPSDGDFLGVLGFNADGFAVVHIDSEQAPADHWGIVRTAMRRAAIEQAPAWLHSYATAGWSAKERRLALPHMLRLAHARHKGVHAVFVDGIADFINDPNAGDEVFPFVDEVRGLSVQYSCPIFAVLHLNPGTEKSRGHLGSQLERRAETNLVLERDPDTGRTIIFSTKQRRAPILKADGPCFRWDDAAQMHVTVGSARAQRDEEEREALHELAADCFVENSSGRMRYCDLVNVVKKTAKCSERAAAEKVCKMRKLGVLIQVPPRLLEFVG